MHRMQKCTQTKVENKAHKSTRSRHSSAAGMEYFEAKIADTVLNPLKTKLV